MNYSRASEDVLLQNEVVLVNKNNNKRLKIKALFFIQALDART